MHDNVIWMIFVVLQANGYPKKFISNTIRASQLPRQPANIENTKNQEQTAPARINLPYVKGTSEQLRRIFNDDNINCTFYTTTTLRTLLSHANNPVPSEQRNNIVYKYDCKDCKAASLENQNEHLQRELKSTLELYELLIPEDMKLLIISGNTTMTSTGKTRK